MPETSKRIAITAELIVRSAMCGESEPMSRHLDCPKEIVLDLWSIALTCGCECHEADEV